MVQQAVATYNSERSHLSLNYQTPDEVHRRSVKKRQHEAENGLKSATYFRASHVQ